MGMSFGITQFYKVLPNSARKKNYLKTTNFVYLIK